MSLRISLIKVIIILIFQRKYKSKITPMPSSSKKQKLSSGARKKTVLNEILKVCKQVGKVKSKKQRSRFWEVLDQVVDPIQPFITKEEARYNHKRIDCLFPAAGSSVPRLKLPKFRPKPRKANLRKSPFLRSSADYLSLKSKRKIEPNPWIDDSSSNDSSIPKKVEKKKANKRHFNEAFLKEDDQIIYVAKPNSDQATTSNIVFFQTLFKSNAAAKKQKIINTPTEKNLHEKKRTKPSRKYSFESIKKFKKCTEETFNINTWTSNQLKNIYPSFVLDNKRKNYNLRFPKLRVSKSEGCLKSNK